MKKIYTSLALPAVLLGIVSSAVAQGTAASGDLIGGGPILALPHGVSCVSPPDEAELASALDALRDRPRIAQANSFELFPRYPLGAVLGEDACVANYVDLDPTRSTQPCIGVQAFNCTTLTYDGHDASDAIIRGFDEQAIGVPVFAGQDGIVIYAHDGEPDMNTVAMGQRANKIVIDHGGERVTEYLHLKKNSVAVTVGQQVVAGQQIALAGSSGNSTWPHLHFALLENRKPLEPFSGQCNPGASLWRNQPPSPAVTPVWEFAFSRQDFSGTNPPYSMPRDGQILHSDGKVYVWALLGWLPAGSQWTMEFWRPNGTLAYTKTSSFNNTCAYNLSWRAWEFRVQDFKTVGGTWKGRLYINGTLRVIAPLRVRSSLAPNQPPARVTLKLDPFGPTDKDPICCQVTSHFINDDPDYDLVRHRWVWRVNGQVVRDVTTAARSDVLARGKAPFGSVVRCDVTPSDGSLWGPTTTISATVAHPLNYPGSREDLELLSGAGGPLARLPEAKVARAGNNLDLLLRSPGGSFVGGIPLLVANLVATGAPPFQWPFLPILHVDPKTALILFYGASAPTGWWLLPPGGSPMRYPLPKAVSGCTIVFQGLVLDVRAMNGWMAASNGQAFEFR